MVSKTERRNHLFNPMRSIVCAAVVMLVGMLSSPVEAATVTWTGAAGNGLWFDAGNWSGGSGVPVAGDDVVFMNPATSAVSLGGGTASIGSVTLTTANGISFSNGSFLLNVFTLNSGISTMNANLTATALTLASDAHFKLDAGAQSTIGTLSVSGQPVQSRVSVLGGSAMTVTTLSLSNARIDIDGSNSRLRFSSGQSAAFSELYLTNGGVLGCPGSIASFIANAGALAVIHVGNFGPPGRLDCPTLNFNKGVNGTALINLHHNQNGYRLERPNGSPVTLNGNMQLTASNAVRSVIPGTHGYTGTTVVSNGAQLELAGVLTGSAVSIASNSALLGNGRIHGTLSVDANAAVRPGAHDGSAPGTLRFGSLNLVDLSALVFDMALPGTVGSPNDLLIVDGDAAVSGGRVNITTLGAVGRYRLMQIGGTTTGSLFLQSVPAGHNLADWQVARSGGEVDLVPPGILQVEPDPLSLATIEQSQVQDTVTLRNVGGGNVHVSQIFPPIHGDFTRQGGTCASSNFDLAPDATCTLIYRFAPSQPGLLSTSATIGTFPQAAGDIAVSLQGSASRLPPQLAPADLNFGVQTVGTSSSAQQANLSNPSAASLSVSAIALDIDQEFAISSNNCPSALAGGATCQISIVFQPLLDGAAVDALQATTDQGVLTVSLQGIGQGIQILGDGFEN